MTQHFTARDVEHIRKTALELQERDCGDCCDCDCPDDSDCFDSEIIMSSVGYFEVYPEMDEFPFPVPDAIASIAMPNGRVRIYTEWGSYPLFYVTRSGSVLCPQCVQSELARCSDPTDEWFVVDSGTHESGDELYCDSCGKPLESSWVAP